MADPRSNLFSVKPCPPENLGKSFANISSATQQRKDFFGAIGKIGDIQVLNSIGASKIGQGLRTLASISNTIRQGCGSLPTSIGSLIGGGLDSGAAWVLDNVGIARTAVDVVRHFNPGVANQAYGQAKAVFEKVKQGGFKTSDIPGVLQDFQNLERLGRHIFTPTSADNRSIMEHCEASPYAIDLISRAPKYKFLFVVQFVYNIGYEEFNEYDFAFVVKKSTRPSVTFVTEDVNYYNYRTKYNTKTDFEDMEMSFHDDTQNNATKFYVGYTRAMSPISNINPSSFFTPEDDGMNFSQSILSQTVIDNSILGGTPTQNLYTASRGPLAQDQTQIIREIKLFHVYDYGKFMNVFRFINPRISNITLDPLDMSIGDSGSEISMKFNYDTVYVDEGVPMNSKEYAIADLGRNAVYPLKYNDGKSEGPVSSNNHTTTPASSTSHCDTKTNTKNPPLISGGGIGGGLGQGII